MKSPQQFGTLNASEELLPLVYTELRRLAAARMASESPDHTLQPTALVHEAYVRLVRGNPNFQWDSQGHFFAAASEAMRRILVESARRKQAEKNGGQRRRVDIDPGGIPSRESPEFILAVDDAIRKLRTEHPEAAELVQLRYFAGLTLKQAAESLQLPLRTADRVWAFARAWLFDELSSVDAS